MWMNILNHKICLRWWSIPFQYIIYIFNLEFETTVSKVVWVHDFKYNILSKCLMFCCRVASGYSGMDDNCLFTIIWFPCHHCSYCYSLSASWYTPLWVAAHWNRIHLYICCMWAMFYLRKIFCKFNSRKIVLKETTWVVCAYFYVDYKMAFSKYLGFDLRKVK